MRNKNAFIGGLLVLIGCLALASRYLFNVEVLHFESGDFWPIFVLGLGLIFEFSYFGTRHAPGLLVPGGILTVSGLLFFFEVATDWAFSAYTWPVYILAVAAGLFQLYLFVGRPKGLLIPVGILTTIAVVSIICIVFDVFFSIFDIGLVVPALLILAGLLVLFRGKPGRSAS